MFFNQVNINHIVLIISLNENLKTSRVYFCTELFRFCAKTCKPDFEDEITKEHVTPRAFLPGLPSHTYALRTRWHTHCE